MKNKFKTLTAILFLTAIILVACKKDKKLINNSTLNNSIWSNNITSSNDVEKLKNELMPKPNIVNSVIKGFYWTDVVFPDGLKISFPGRGWTDKNGMPVTGKIEIEEYYIDKKGKNILMNMPTQTNTQNLVSGGSYYINFKQNGQEITNPNYYYLDMPIQNKESFQIFTANANQNWSLVPNAIATLVQNPSLDSNWNRDTTILSSRDLFKIPCKFRFINCDYFWDFTGVKCIIKVKLPKEFGNCNSKVYCIVNNRYVVFNLNPDVEKFMFSSLINGITVPVGESCKLVVISKIGDKYYATLKDIIATDNKLEELEPTEITKAQMEAFLNTI